MNQQHLLANLYPNLKVWATKPERSYKPYRPYKGGNNNDEKMKEAKYHVNSLETSNAKEAKPHLK